MRHLISVLLLAVASAMPATAQNVIRNIGFSNSENIDVAGAYFGTAGTYSVGVRFDSDFLESYDGCRIIGMKVAAACDLGRTRAFIYDASSPATPLAAQKQRIYEGWNEISLSGNGLVIDKDTPLFCGFDYTETAAMVTAEEGGLCFAGSATSGGLMLLAGGKLQEIQFNGSLCVQLTVDVSNMPQRDFRFTFFDPGYRYRGSLDKFEMMGTLENIGLLDASALTLAYSFDDMEPVTTVVETPVAPGATYSWQLSTQLPASLGAGAHEFRAWVESIDGEPTGHMTAPSRCASALFYVHDGQLQRHFTYVEVYADQDSPYSAALEEAFAAAGLDDSAQIVNLFSPESSLNVPQCDFWTASYAYTFPSFTVNRSYFPCESHIAYDLNDYLFTFPDYFLTAILGDVILSDNSSVCLTDITLSGSLDSSSRHLDVTASGNLMSDALAVYGDIAVTLMLVEDGVKSPQTTLSATSRPVTDRQYVHNNVLRAYITSPRGDKVDPDGKTYSADFTIDIDPAWNIENLRVVGLVSRSADHLTADNMKYYDISDTNILRLSDIASVESVVNDESGLSPATYFTIDGRQATEPLQPGIYIRRLSDGTSSKVLVR